jgi:hypothetical protein
MHPDHADFVERDAWIVVNSNGEATVCCLFKDSVQRWMIHLLFVVLHCLVMGWLMCQQAAILRVV